MRLLIVAFALTMGSVFAEEEWEEEEELFEADATPESEMPDPSMVGIGRYFAENFCRRVAVIPIFACLQI